MLDVI